MNPSPPPQQGHRRTLSSTVVDESVAAAATLVAKWHPDDDGYSLFLHASSPEADHFLRAAADLHRAMLFFASDPTNNSHDGQGLVHAHDLLDTAMRRLQIELRLLLSAPAPGRDHDASRLRALAEAMMGAGYGKECISTFKERLRAALRRRLQYTPVTVQLHKLTSWEQVDDNIQSWVAAARVAFSSVFPAEKDLCDAVFAAGEVADAVFEDVANDLAANLVSVAEAAVARARRAPERLFRVLDVHDALTEVLPAIVSVFGDRSEVAKRACSALFKAGEAARGALASFEAAINKEPSNSKASTAAGGAVHPLTRYVMNYLVLLADYDAALDRIIISNQQQQGSPPLSSSMSIGRLVQVLVWKIEAKAGSYREAALRHLFLANNMHYVARKLHKLQQQQQGAQAQAQEYRVAARRHVEAYVSEAWGKVLKAISAAADGVMKVEAAVTEAVAMQDTWVAADEEMADALRNAATTAVVPRYRMFYRRHGAAVRLTPGDVHAMITALFATHSTSSC